MLLRSLVALATVTVVSLALVACTRDAKDATIEPIVPTAELTLTASPEPTATPTEASDAPRRTGDPALDAIIEAVETRDIEALAPLVEYQVLGCTNELGAGGPPKCEDGQPGGSEMRVFPFSSCEVEWTRFGTQVVAQFAHGTAGLWGVLDVDRYWESTDGWRTPDTFLVFHHQGSAGYLEIADGQIVRASLGCGGGSLQDLLAMSSMQLSLAAGPWDEPTSPPSVAPPSTGTDAVDGILAAVATYDWVTLRQSALDAMEDLPDFACEEPPLQGAGGIECDPKNGEVAGDLVSVFPLAYCEGALVRDPYDAVRAFLDGVPVLHSVLEAPSEPSQSDLYPHGAYWIVYELPNLQGGVQEGARLHVTAEGNLTVIWYGCAPSLKELVEWDGQPMPRLEVREG